MMKTLLLTTGVCAVLSTHAFANAATQPQTSEIPMTATALKQETSSIEITPGLTYEQTQAGTGDKPKKGDMVSVHYVGTLTDGTKFDSSRDRGEPISFKLGVGQVIQGWDKGIMELSVGERGVLTIAPELGYGDRGAGGSIPGGATLLFDVELVSIN